MSQETWDDQDATSTTPSEFAQLFGATQQSKRLRTGERISGTVILIGSEEIFINTGGMQDGMLSKRELGAAAQELKVGDKLECVVRSIRGDDIRLGLLGANHSASSSEDVREGALVKGRVLEAVKGGVRVAVMGKTAFCPLSHLDSTRIESVEPYLGKTFDFTVSEIKGKDIIVSRRKLLNQDRDAAFEVLQSSNNSQSASILHTGKVVRVEPFGAFVKLENGLEGLVHVSEISWSRIEDVNDHLKVGDSVTVTVKKTETTDKGPKISFSMKTAEGDPWGRLPSTVAVGNVVSGKVTRIAKFGAFVEIIPGVDGLVPLSEMSYTKRIINAEDVVKVGEAVLVMIKDILLEQKRMSLSLKDAGSDPWALIQSKYPIGTVHEGRVAKRETFGFFIELEPGVQGLLHHSTYRGSDDEAKLEKLRALDTLEVKVLAIDEDQRRISLGLKGSGHAEDWKEFQSKEAKEKKPQGSFGSSLADKLKSIQVKKK